MHPLPTDPVDVLRPGARPDSEWARTLETGKYAGQLQPEIRGWWPQTDEPGTKPVTTLSVRSAETPGAVRVATLLEPARRPDAVAARLDGFSTGGDGWDLAVETASGTETVTLGEASGEFTELEYRSSMSERTHRLAFETHVR